MKIITVSDETKHLIDAQALPGYTIRRTATRLPDGRWTIPVDDEVFDRIAAARLPGETDDDVVGRLLRAAIGKKPS
ncbi:MAG: hypothetical protein HY834_16510 [Devosia nanyangense]|uniref:Uncharacterized protein n=1 Tax=Devosia nanyangense TaxID=1228055 RepID=A0A933NZG4_9HYPH|nr:hypothetical protein [Devosia nanyangense]